MPSIFISHSSEDKVIAHALAQEFERRGYSYFLDFKSIAGGTQWEEEIYNAMRQCIAVVLCATPRAMASKFTFAEIVMARYARKTLVALIMEKCDLPGFVTATTQYIDMTVDPATGYEKLWQALSRLDLSQADGEWQRGKSPYLGLMTLQEEHAPVFFGRDREVQMAIDALRPSAERKRFLAIIGPSGSGKSSLVRAGILPKLKRGAIARSEQWRYVPTFTPNDDPFTSLAAALRAADSSLGVVQDIRTRLQKPMGLRDELLNLHPVISSREAARNLVLTIDQLEEIERRTPRSVATEFLARLREALDVDITPLIVLATLRADFFSDCLQFPDLAGLLQTGTQPLGVMDRMGLRQAIMGPARVAGLTFDDGLVEEILDDTKGGDALPLMAFVLEQMWEQRSDSTLTRAVYRKIGGVEGALCERAQTIYDTTPEAERVSLHIALIELSDVNEHGDFTRRRVFHDSLPSDSQPALDRFIQARLLTTSSNEYGAQIEVTHEALLRNWKMLRGWLESENERLRLRHDIELAAREWDAHGRPDTYLWSSERAREAANAMTIERWLHSDLKLMFLETCTERERKRQEESRITTAKLAGRTSLAWIGMIGATWRHTIEKNAITIRDQIESLKLDIVHKSQVDRVTERLNLIERLANQILDKPLIPPLDGEENVSLVPINEFLRMRAERLWRVEPYRSVALELCLNLEDSAQVRTSPEWLRRALDIVLENSVDATTEIFNRKITICSQRKGSHGEISIIDNGYGISDQVMERLFREPIRKTQDRKGTGMGLLLAQMIIETYGGEIAIRETGPTGTTVLMTLPLE